MSNSSIAVVEDSKRRQSCGGLRIQQRVYVSDRRAQIDQMVVCVNMYACVVNGCMSSNSNGTKTRSGPLR